ncbi:alpha/beta hydrolase [Luteolibacter marinus]|uniref:alpha/beta hydrolase n=1 Tax=Luteolibacter marinus TaxID=2776705 RepID=UPI001868A8CA|nr:hypothetical protein [Luteolibacter marinus]
MIVRPLPVCLALAVASARAEPMTVERLPVPVELSLPENHDPAKKWPAVFFYHGLGGHPTTTMIRRHTGAKDWIVVGMTFSFEGAFRYSPDNLKKELAILQGVRDRLAAEQGLDPGRLFVSGFSQGGWVSGMFFQADRSLAGAAILGAGHMNQLSPQPASYPGTPLFLGAGRMDGVYPFALKARLFYGKLGAAVTMETWHGLKHEFPGDGSPGLTEWFTLRNGGVPDTNAIEADYAKLLELPPLAQWRGLLDLRERPFVNAPGQPWPETIRKRIAVLEADPAVAGEARLFGRHRHLLAGEVNMKTLEDLAKVKDGYDVLVLEAGDSPQTELIEADRQRVTGLLESFEAQRAQQPPEEKPVRPDFPKSDRGIPRNPLVR